MVVDADALLPALPLIVSVVLLFAAAEDDGVSVRVVEPLVVTLPGLNAALTPVGSPVTLKFTVPVNPPVGVIVILSVADDPPKQKMKKQTGGVTVTVPELADSLNVPFAAVTVNDCETGVAAA